MILDFEGSTSHPSSRLCPADENRIHTLTRNSDMPFNLFNAGLRLFADSIIEYHGKDIRKSEIRYYPSVILTFWSAFETFVRYSSVTMLITVRNIPNAIERYLREQEEFLDRKGFIKTRTRYQSVLERYVVLLRYGYNYKIDRGNKHWQSLEEAKTLRDYYTHLDVNDPRSISSIEVLDFMEAVLIGIIWPSSEIQRTLLLNIYFLYYILAELKEMTEEYIENPLLKDFLIGKRYGFYCPFKNVDTDRFPNYQEERMHRGNK